MAINAIERPRIIAGSGRSGTTWILDVLADTNGLRPVFEPMHPQAVTAAKPYAWRYLEPGIQLADLENLFDKIFSGSLHTIWTDYRIRPTRLIPRRNNFSSLKRMYALFSEWRAATKRRIVYRHKVRSWPVLVKMIRANLMLGWLREKYDAQIVFVARHPGAVIESKTRLGGISWDPVTMLNYYRAENVLGKCHKRYHELLEQELSPVEAHTLIWCIENQLPIEQAEKHAYLPVFYEDLITDGERVWLRIIKALSLEKSPWGTTIINRPSQQASSSRSIRKLGAGSRWYDRLAKHDLEDIERILNVCGVGSYTAFDPLPQRPSSVDNINNS